MINLGMRGDYCYINQKIHEIYTGMLFIWIVMKQVRFVAFAVAKCTHAMLFLARARPAVKVEKSENFSGASEAMKF
jgi:hypothetical protein